RDRPGRRTEFHAGHADSATFPGCGSGRLWWWDGGSWDLPKGSSWPGGGDAVGGHQALRPTAPFSGNEKISPKLQINEAPDTVGGVFETLLVALEKPPQLALIHVSGENPVVPAQQLQHRGGAPLAQPLAQGRGKPHLLAVNDLPGQQVLDGSLQDVLG